MDATEAAVHFASALQRAHIPYAIGGAIAYGFFGAARGTHDVDLNIFLAGEQAATAIDALVTAGLGIDRKSALESAVERGDARGTFAGMPVDLFFNSIPVHERAALRTRQVVLHGQPVHVLSPEDSAIFKMLFFRGKDLVDVERLLALTGASLDRDYVRSALIEVVGADDFRTRKWDAMVVALGLAPNH